MQNYRIEEQAFFAQNYPQLIAQGVRQKLSKEDLRLLRKGFDIALEISDGLYRAQGIPLLNHLIRTASIVLSQTSSINTVLLALLHASFVVSKFDDSCRSANHKLIQTEIEHEFGHQLANSLLAYEAMDWYQVIDVQYYIANTESLEPLTKELLLVRLANELEDHMDYAMLFTPSERLARRSRAYGDACVVLARQLGYQTIAEQLDAILKAQQIFDLDDKLKFNKGQGYELRKRRWVASYSERVIKALKRLKAAY